MLEKFVVIYNINYICLIMKKVLVPKLITNHDFITLRLPIGNFTINRNGSKVSGELAHMKVASDALEKYVEEKRATNKLEDVMNSLLNVRVLRKLVPNWDKPTSKIFSKDDVVEFVNPVFKKKYNDKYVVKSSTGKSTTILICGAPVSVSSFELDLCESITTPSVLKK